MWIEMVCSATKNGVGFHSILSQMDKATWKVDARSRVVFGEDIL